MVKEEYTTGITGTLGKGRKRGVTGTSAAQGRPETDSESHTAELAWLSDTQDMHSPTNNTHFPRLEQAGVKRNQSHSPETQGTGILKEPGPSSTPASAQHWLLGLLVASEARNPRYFLSCKQTLQDACSDRPCLLYRHVSGAGQLLCFQFLRKGVTSCYQLLPGKLQTDTGPKGQAKLFQCW